VDEVITPANNVFRVTEKPIFDVSGSDQLSALGRELVVEKADLGEGGNNLRPPKSSRRLPLYDAWSQVLLQAARVRPVNKKRPIRRQRQQIHRNDTLHSVRKATDLSPFLPSRGEPTRREDQDRDIRQLACANACDGSPLHFPVLEMGALHIFGEKLGCTRSRPLKPPPQAPLLVPNPAFFHPVPLVPRSEDISLVALSADVKGSQATCPVDWDEVAA
jgi:hypothetical protein